MTEAPPRVGPIGIIGDLADADLVLAELLLRQEADVRVMRMRRGSEDALNHPFYTTLTSERIVHFDSRWALLMALRSCRFVYSVTSSLFFDLRELGALYPALRRLGWPPYMVVCSGSNITERAVARSITGVAERASLRGAHCVAVNNYPAAIKNSVSLGLRNRVYVPFPYPVDCERTPAIENRCGPLGLLRVFHPSHIDWGESDSGREKTSGKGNDLFLRAFIRACKGGLKAHCVILDRGQDAIHARRLIQDSCAGEFFTWKPELTRTQFDQELFACDLVVDQFLLGAIGGVGFEAMARGKMVIGHIEPQCHHLIYDEALPIGTARTESEIESRLWEFSDFEHLQRSSRACHEWLRRHQDPHVLGLRYLSYALSGMRSLGVGKSLFGN